MPVSLIQRRLVVKSTALLPLCGNFRDRRGVTQIRLDTARRAPTLWLKCATPNTLAQKQRVTRWPSIYANRGINALCPCWSKIGDCNASRCRELLDNLAFYYVFARVCLAAVFVSGCLVSGHIAGSRVGRVLVHLCAEALNVHLQGFVFGADGV